MIKRFLTTGTAAVVLAATSFIGAGAAAPAANATTCPTGSWSSETLGRPANVARGMEGIAVYRNHDDSVFSIRMSTSHRFEVYWGSITTDGTLHYTLARTERGDYARKVSANKVVFLMTNFGGIDGLDVVPTCASQVTFHFGVFHHAVPTSNVYLGSTAAHPSANPFTEAQS